MTRELIAGITRFSSLGFMLLGAVRPGAAGRDYAAWRLLPHLYAPKSWNLPLDLGLVAGFSFQRTTYEENSRRVEIRPISEKKFGHFQLDANPFFGRALYGPGVREGWNFEPAGRCQAFSRAPGRSTRFTPAPASAWKTACSAAPASVSALRPPVRACLQIAI